MIYEEDEKLQPPILVFSFIKPTMSTQFLHHILLSMGKFETEFNRILQLYVKESFRYAKLIGLDDDEDDFVDYAKKVHYLFITKQLCLYPNGQRLIDPWIITSGELFDGVIIRDEIPISDMPIVQMSTLLATREEEVDMFFAKVR